MKRQLKIDVKKTWISQYDDHGNYDQVPGIEATANGYFIDTGASRILKINVFNGLPGGIPKLAQKKLVIEFDESNQLDPMNLKREAYIRGVSQHYNTNKYYEVFIKKIGEGWFLTWDDENLDAHLKPSKRRGV